VRVLGRFVAGCLKASPNVRESKEGGRVPTCWLNSAPNVR
jgi:hypothetical protein